MTAFDKKVNQIAARHGWNISPVSGWYIPAYSIVPMDRKERDQITAFFASFFRGVVRGGRLESIAGHSFPRGVHDIPRHAFPGVGGGGVQILFNFFRDSN